MHVLLCQIHILLQQLVVEVVLNDEVFAKEVHDSLNRKHLLEGGGERDFSRYGYVKQYLQRTFSELDRALVGVDIVAQGVYSNADLISSRLLSSTYFYRTKRHLVKLVDIVERGIEQAHDILQHEHTGVGADDIGADVVFALLKLQLLHIDGYVLQEGAHDSLSVQSHRDTQRGSVIRHGHLHGAEIEFIWVESRVAQVLVTPAKVCLRQHSGNRLPTLCVCLLNSNLRISERAVGLDRIILRLFQAQAERCGHFACRHCLRSGHYVVFGLGCTCYCENSH